MKDEVLYALWRGGRSVTGLADDYGVAVSTVARAVCRKVPPPKKPGKRPIKMLGRVFGPWRVERLAYRYPHLRRNGDVQFRYFWRCKCVGCGAKRTIRGSELRERRTGGCACGAK